MLHHPLQQRQKKRTTSLHYTEILNNILPSPPNTSLQKHIHNSITTPAIQNLQPSNILKEPPPDVNTSELTLSREIRTNLARLRFGHHPSLKQYRNRLDLTQDPLCLHYNAAPHTTPHSFIPLTQLRQSFNISSAKDRSKSNYLRSIGLMKIYARG